MEDDDWDHLDFERDDHLEEFCRERLNRVSTNGWIPWLGGTQGILEGSNPEGSNPEGPIPEGRTQSFPKTSPQVTQRTLSVLLLELRRQDVDREGVLPPSLMDQQFEK